MHFHSTIEPILDGSFQLKLKSSNGLKDVSTLENLSQALPKSFKWRDAVPNWVAGGFNFEDDSMIHFTVVPVGIKDSRDMIDLHYYKGILMYIDYHHPNGPPD